MQTPILAGNWKMNKTPAEAVAFFEAFCAVHPARRDRSLWFFPPAISFAAARDSVRDRPDILLGVQNVHWERAGAFTGETSAVMAAAAGARLALVGHSERRHVFGETDAETGRKAAAAIAAQLLPILCVGETLEQRRAGTLEDVLVRQLDAGLAALAGDPTATLVLAYEPVWAIGTGVTATPADASEAHGLLRDRLTRRFGSASVAVPILYGGSVSPDNAGALLAARHVDGLLVGGASLDPGGFARIAAAAAPD